MRIDLLDLWIGYVLWFNMGWSVASHRWSACFITFCTLFVRWGRRERAERAERHRDDGSQAVEQHQVDHGLSDLRKGTRRLLIWRWILIVVALLGVVTIAAMLA